MKPAIGGILIITAVVAVVGLVIAGSNSIQGALTTPTRSAVKTCATHCADEAALQKTRCLNALERCNLVCRGESIDIGKQAVCQARCTSDSQVCLAEALGAVQGCISLRTSSM
ncbi:hypothetical protein HY641_01245 [Candidatus Woesearchaeota archaeon]|nr:hypothetical protein [Candidatus Woesearchaeota archaeon]